MAEIESPPRRWKATSKFTSRWGRPNTELHTARRFSLRPLSDDRGSDEVSSPGRQKSNSRGPMPFSLTLSIFPEGVSGSRFKGRKTGLKKIATCGGNASSALEIDP
ncbi:hypothetical protein WAI453_007441 [Rhynchosporium graminicola]